MVINMEDNPDKYTDPKELDKMAKAVEEALMKGVASNFLHALQGDSSSNLNSSTPKTETQTKTKS